MALVTMKELLEAGVHFGHQTRRWNPKMKRFIYAGRNGIYIIDLHQTLRRLDDAYKFVREAAAGGGRTWPKQAGKMRRSCPRLCTRLTKWSPTWPRKSDGLTRDQSILLLRLTRFVFRVERTFAFMKRVEPVEDVIKR